MEAEDAAPPTPMRLRPGVHAAPVGGGLLITGRGTTSLVRGDATILDAVWLRMLPAFHRGTDPKRLASLTPVAAAIIEALESAGLLLPVDPAWPDHPTVEYLASIAPDPVEAWARFRALRVAILGTGPAAAAAARALFSFGLPESQLGQANPDIVITIDTSPPTPDNVAWIGIASCGDRIVIGPLRTQAAALSLNDAVAMLGAEPAPTSPVAARLAGNLAAVDVLAFGAGLPADYRWRALVVHVDGARVEPVLVATPGAHPLTPDNVPSSASTTTTGTSPLAPPQPVFDLAGSAPVAQIRLLDGRVVLAFGTDAPEAGRNASVAAARCFLPPPIPELWLANGTPAITAPPTDVVTVAGTDTDGFLRDALRRVLSTRIADLPCFPKPRTVAVTELPADLAADVPFFERLQIPLTITVHELPDAPGTFAAATVATYGRTLAFDCAGDEESALRGAFHQAMLVVQRGTDPCPTYADDAKWDPAPVLKALAAAGTPLAVARWTGAPATALPAIVGWAALVAEDEQ